MSDTADGREVKWTRERKSIGIAPIIEPVIEPIIEPVIELANESCRWSSLYSTRLSPYSISFIAARLRKRTNGDGGGNGGDGGEDGGEGEGGGGMRVSPPPKGESIEPVMELANESQRRSSSSLNSSYSTSFIAARLRN